MKIVALAIAVICFALAALYATGHFPGMPVRHMKHAVALGLVGVLALVWMRMQSNSTAVASN
jgi:hypothetical protein